MTSGFFMSWGLVALSALLDSYAATIAKIRFNELGGIDFSSLSATLRYLAVFFTSPLLLSAVAAFLLAPVCWFLALNRVELSVAYPLIVGLHLIFIALFSVVFVGESITGSKVLGTALIGLSTYVFSR